MHKLATIERSMHNLYPTSFFKSTQEDEFNSYTELRWHRVHRKHGFYLFERFVLESEDPRSSENSFSVGTICTPLISTSLPQI